MRAGKAWEAGAYEARVGERWGGKITSKDRGEKGRGQESTLGKSKDSGLRQEVSPRKEESSCKGRDGV